jgi:HK97 family phage major capsid protein
MASAAPGTILGYQYVINPNMASIGASAKSVLFGDFANYVIRYAGPERLKVLTERFADTDQIGLVLLQRVDAMLMDAGTHPIKYLIHAAS